MPQKIPPLPPESLSKLFLRFLKFGLLAWGGPVAQIDMIRREIVEQEKWITRRDFNHVLGMYQALPGPEATELCVYFGYIKRGRLGGIMAGLGFFLPGFFLMLILSWFYVKFGLKSAMFTGLFYGLQATVAALIIRAVHRIGKNALTDHWLTAIAIISTLGQLLSLHFAIIITIGGLFYLYIHKKITTNKLISILLITAAITTILITFQKSPLQPEPITNQIISPPSPITLLISGLKTGLLTFGGAYTSIPFLQNDAVEVGHFITNQQFLDGLALSAIIPAPLIIFGTFVGYLGGGLLGAILLTFGIFLPAFSFTLIGHKYLEKLIAKKSVRLFLDGLTAGVVGLIAGTTIKLLPTAITDLTQFIIFILTLTLLYRYKNKTTVLWIIFGAGIMGVVIKSL